MKVGLALFIGILCGLFVLFGSSWYEAKHKNKGNYMPWRAVEFTYKEYSGQPGIDDDAFLEVVQNIEPEKCLLFYETYPFMSGADLHKMSDNDPDAMFDMFVRLVYPGGVYNDSGMEKGLPYLRRAAERGHVNASIASLIFPLDENKFADNILKLEEYEKMTPLASYVKILLQIASGEKDYSSSLIPLKYAGGYYFLMANGVHAEIASGYIDKDILCEAYFNGCTSLYEEKKKYKIKCAD